MNIYKLFSLIVAMYFALPAIGQVTRGGNFMLGGTVGFSTAESTVDVNREGNSFENAGTRSTQFNIAPALGYFVVDNWSLGIGLDYTLNRVREPIDPTDPQTNYETSYDNNLLFGPFSRVYLPVGRDKAFFLEGTLGFGSSRDEIQVDGVDQTISNNVLAIGIGPGFTIFSNDALGIEALVKYNWSRSNADINFQGISTETTSFTNQIDFSIGFQVYFTRIARAELDNRNRAPATGGEEDDPDFY